MDILMMIIMFVLLMVTIIGWYIERNSKETYKELYMDEYNKRMELKEKYVKYEDKIYVINGKLRKVRVWNEES